MTKFLHRPTRSLRLAPYGAVAGWLLIVGWLTLRPDHAAVATAAATPLWCIVCGEAGTADLILNLALFAPLGWALARDWRLQSVVLLALVISVAIEAAQALALVGRDAALGDLVANSSGAALGWLLRRAMARSVARALAAPALLALFASHLGMAGWLAAPDVAGAERAELVVAPPSPGRPTYRGAVTSLHLGDIRLAGDRDGERPDRATLAVSFLWDDVGSSKRGAVVARVTDTRGHPLASLAQDATGATLSARTLGARLRLRTPRWQAPRFGAPLRGDTVRVALTMERGNARLVSSSARGTRADTVRHGAQHGWVLLNPFATPAGAGDSWRWWTAGWLVGWGALLGWGAAYRRRSMAWGIAAVAVLFVITAAAGATANATEAGALLLGWLLGLSSGLFRPRRASA